MQLARKFGAVTATHSNHPLTDDEIVRVAPSIFAKDAHESRSKRYTYIPTIDVLNGLRREGFQPFMVCQTRVRLPEKASHTKHMIRLRHADRIRQDDVNEIILLNSHDGTSSYQMLAGVFRFVCTNGMVCGDMINDLRVRHSGNVVGEVIEGAYEVLEEFDRVDAAKDGMKSLTLNAGEQNALAHAALTLRWDDPETPAPVTEAQILTPKRVEDTGSDLWSTFNRVQENLTRGGPNGRDRTGRRRRTRPVTGIDQNVKLNRALWVLAEEMRRLKS